MAIKDPFAPDAVEADPFAPGEDPFAPERPVAPAGYKTTQEGIEGVDVPYTPEPVKPTSMSMFGDSLKEDYRRVKEAVGSIPTKAPDIVYGAAEAITGVPLRQMGREMTQQAIQSVKGTPIQNPVTKQMKAEGYDIPRPGPVFETPTHEEWMSHPYQTVAKDVINTIGEAPTLDVEFDGTSARQIANYAAHKTTGRVLNWLQDVGGKPVAQMLRTTGRMGAEGVHAVTGIPRDQPVVTANQEGIWLGPSEGGVELIKGIDQNPELHEHATAILLEQLGGTSMQAPPGVQETAREQMRKEYGDIGGKVFELGLELFGTWPVMLLPGVGQLNKAVALEESAVLETALTKTGPGLANSVSTASPSFVAKMAPKLPGMAMSQAVKVNMAEGALQSYYMASARKGGDITTEMGLGAALGGLIGLGVGAYQAKKLPGLLSKALDPTVVVPAKTMDEVVARLDEAFTRIKPKVRKGGAAQTAKQDAVAGQKTSARLTAPETKPGGGLPETVGGEWTQRINPKTGKTYSEYAPLEGPLPQKAPKGENILPGTDLTPDFDIDLVPGDVVQPSFSKFTYDGNGNFVLREYEITAGPGRAKSNVSVEPTKGTGRKTAHSTNVTAKYRDTLITEDAMAERLIDQPGRNVNMSAMTPDELAELDAMIRRARGPQPESPAGTFNRLSPEDAAMLATVVRDQGLIGVNGKVMVANMETRARLNQALNNFQKGKRRPTIMTVTPEGRLQFTEVPEQTPRPVDDAVRVGDNVKIDGNIPAEIVDVRADGDATAKLITGQMVNIRKSSAVLDAEGRLKWQAKKRWEAYELDKPRPERRGHRYDERASGAEASAAPDGATLSPRTQAIIKASKDITPQDVVRWEGLGINDLGHATGALRKLEQEGVLRHTGGGHFTPTKPSGPKPRDVSMDGEFVYIGTGGPSLHPNDPHGTGVVGILRGKDPRTKGNYLVEVPDVASGVDQVTGNFNKTKFKSIPEAEVRTMKPVGMADKSKVNPNIDMYGWTKPMPTQFVQASQGALQDIEEMTKFWSKVAPASLQGASAAKYASLKETMGGAMHTADWDVRTSKAQKMFSAGQVMKGEGMSTADYLANKLGGIGSSANQELTAVLESAASRSPSGVAQGIDPVKLQAWATKYPKEAQASMADIKALVAQRDAQSALLVQYGIPQVQAAEAAREELAAYLTRNYAAFNMPREDWAKFARKNLTQEWHSLIEYLTETRPELQASQHAANVESILRLDDPIQGFRDAGYIKAEAKAKLREKIEVPEPIRAVLGEFKDASTRLAFTVAYQRQLLKGIEGWSAIAQSPNLWSPGWRPDMTLPIPDDPLFGAARNGFVHDNKSMRFLIEGRKSSNIGDSVGFLRASGWLGQRWKAAHTVWNPVAWANNVMRGTKTMLFSGGFLGPEDFEAFREAAAMLRDYGNDPTIYGRNKLLVEAMDFDAVGPGLAGAELGLSQRKFQRAVFDSFANQKGASLTDLFGQKLRDVAMAVPESVHNGYDSIDKVIKLGCYLNLRRRFIAQGMSVDDAAAMASLRVNQSAQNFAQTPEWLKRTVGAGNFSLLAPFASSKLEDVRINATLLARVGKTLDPRSAPHEREYDLLARLAYFSALMGGMATVAINTRRMNGISDAEDDAQRAAIPLRTKQYHPLLLGSLDYDEKGRRVFYPFEQNEDLAMAFRGNVHDPALVTFVMNNLLEVVGHGTVVGAGLEGAAGQTGLYTPRPPMPPPRPDQKGLLDTAMRVGKPFAPQGAINVYNAYNNLDPSGRLVNPEALTPGQALARSLGAPQPIPVGPASITQSNMENVGAVLQGKDDVTRAAKESALAGESEERRRYRIKADIDEMRKKLRAVPRSLKDPK